MRVFETEGLRQVTGVLRAAPSMGRLVVVCGQNGWGKSEAVDRAPARDEALATRLATVRLEPYANSGRGFWGCIAWGLGVVVGRSDGAADLARQVAMRLEQTEQMLVLDHAEHLRPSSLAYLRHAIDLLGNLVVVGSLGLQATMAPDDALSARLRYRFDMPKVDEAELHKALGGEFCADWISEAHRAGWGAPDPRVVDQRASYGWNTVWGMVESERMRSLVRQRPTTDATADDARRVLKTLSARAA